MNSGLFVIGLLVAVAFVAAAKKRTINGMDDPQVTIDNIHRGVANGWYTCTLTRVDGAPAVRLSGRKADGEFYSDIYPVSEADWQILKAEGYNEA